MRGLIFAKSGLPKYPSSNHKIKHMKKLALLCIFFAGLAAESFAQSSMGNIDPNAPVIVLDKKEYDFGTIKQGEKVSYTLKLKNSGKSPLIITDIGVTCGCTTPVWPKDPIAPGKTVDIQISFNSTGKMGAQTKPVTIHSNNKDGDVVFTLKGNVEAPKPAASTLPTEKKEGPVEKKD
jgi:hypothetical protein